MARKVVGFYRDNKRRIRPITPRTKYRAIKNTHNFEDDGEWIEKNGEMIWISKSDRDALYEKLINSKWKNKKESVTELNAYGYTIEIYPNKVNGLDYKILNNNTGKVVWDSGTINKKEGYATRKDAERSSIDLLIDILLRGENFLLE